MSIFLYQYPVIPAPFVENIFLYPPIALVHLLKILTLYEHVYFWALYSIPLIYFDYSCLAPFLIVVYYIDVHNHVGSLCHCWTL